MAPHEENMKSLETLTSEDYDKILKIFADISPTNEADRTVLKRVVEANNLVGKTITFMDIGAGNLYFIQYLTHGCIIPFPFRFCRKKLKFCRTSG